MSETAVLPTRKDEDWRYSAVGKLTPADLDHHHTIRVEADEKYRDCIVIDDIRVASGTDAIVRYEIDLQPGARCDLFAVLAASDFARVQIDVRLGRGAHFEFGGITVGGRDTVREFVTHAVHAEPEATSNQTIRSVHWGQGTGNFLGRIDVVRDAQKTDAAQSFKGLLLDKGASVNCVPQLEIFADDVKCAHGATVGQLDESARYYMASRGLSPEQSRRLLVQAFIGDALVAMDDESERERLMQVALDKLDRHL
uniref:SufD family Fe-S cluster assembly protein n=1 Tax=Parerythrobacter lutipelagi TaxID=1964208 RepID=UPI0010F93685|nr:SufD family Fe-S cluster assembly protein [Parerythrobacter lutipelagi]